MFLSTLLAIANSQYFASSSGVEFPRYGKRSDQNKEVLESNENDKANLQSLIQKSLVSKYDQTHSRKIAKDNLVRRILIEYLKSQSEND
jgi:hypothetical protein